MEDSYKGSALTRKNVRFFKNMMRSKYFKHNEEREDLCYDFIIHEIQNEYNSQLYIRNLHDLDT